MLGQLLAKVLGTQNDRELKRLTPLVSTINELESSIESLSDLKGRHVAWVEEFPSLSCLKDSPQEALSGIRQQVADTLRDLQAQGERVPAPKSASSTH